LNYTWKILSIKANDDGLITQAQYHARVAEDDAAVETEGTWFFKGQRLNVPFAKVTEDLVVGWIKTESDGLIEKRMAQQLKNLAAKSETPLPWMPQVFTPKFEE
jgi:hypothetical protein